MKALLGILGASAALLATPATAQDTIKIGVILPYSGQFADTGVQLDNGIKLYMKQHGDTVAGKKIEVIRKDVGGIAPDVAKRLAFFIVMAATIAPIICAMTFATSGAMALRRPCGSPRSSCRRPWRCSFM